MQSHPTRGWSGHPHVTAEVRRQSPFRKLVSPLFRLSNIKVCLFWVFPSASWTIINIEPTLSFKQINTLHLSLKIWHCTNISMLWSLLPMLQLYMYERAKWGSLLEECAWFDTILKPLKSVYVVDIFLTSFSQEAGLKHVNQVKLFLTS